MCGSKWLAPSVVLSIFLLGCGGDREPDQPKVETEQEREAELVADEQVPTDLGDEALAEWLIDRARYAEAHPVMERVVQIVLDLTK